MIRSQQAFLGTNILQCSIRRHQTCSEVLERYRYSSCTISALFLHYLGNILQGVWYISTIAAWSETIKDNLLNAILLFLAFQPSIELISQVIGLNVVFNIIKRGIHVNTSIAMVILYITDESLHTLEVETIFIV